MKKKFSYVLTAIALTVSISCTNKDEAKKFSFLDLKGDSQFLVAQSGHQDQFIYASLSFKDSGAVVELNKMNGEFLLKHFVACNYLNDSIIIAFDEKSKLVHINKNKNIIRDIPVRFDFTQLNLVTDVRYGSVKGQRGLLCNTGNSIIFFGLEIKEFTNPVTPVTIVAGESRIQNFDIFKNKIILCNEEVCDNKACSYLYVLIDLSESTRKDIFRIKRSESLTYPPCVALLNENEFVTNFYDSHTNLLVKSLDDKNQIKKYSIGNLKIINVLTEHQSLYMTVLDEELRSKSPSSNPYKSLYYGMRIISFK